MTARQQIARLLPLGLLVVLVIAGLRGAVPAPGWNGPLRAYGTPIGIALEVLCGALLITIRVRERAARREAESRPYSAEEKDIEPAGALRFTLKYVLGLCMVAIAIVLISDLHLHFFAKPRFQPPPLHRLKAPTDQPRPGGGGFTFHVPLGPILYGLLVVALVAAVAISIWWSTRLRGGGEERRGGGGGEKEGGGGGGEGGERGGEGEVRMLSTESLEWSRSGNRSTVRR